MRVRLRCTGGLHGTPWREVPVSGHVIFERTEFGERRDLPTDFILDVEADIVVAPPEVQPSGGLPWFRRKRR